MAQESPQTSEAVAWRALGHASPLSTFLVLSGLFVAGALQWFFFFNQGNFSFQFHNWTLFGGYLGALQQAVQTHQVPFHIADAVGLTDRFLAVPEVPVSPQLLLLAYLPVGRFIVLNTLLLYSAGFAGCLLLRRKFQLSIIPFTFFFLLFNANGFITANLGMGHFWAGGYFFLPFFFLFFLDWPAGRPSIANCLGISLVLSAMFLQGSFHVAIWCALLLLLFTAFEPSRLRSFAVVIGATSLISSFRLVPGAIAYWNKGYPFAYGIPSVRDLFDGLTATPFFTSNPGFGQSVWLGKDFFVGLVGLAAIIYFGVWLRFSRDPALEAYRYAPLDKPLAVLSVLSLGYFSLLVTLLPLPLIRAERVSSRFLILPLLALTLISAIRMQHSPGILAKTTSRMIWSMVALAQIAFELTDHSFFWKPPYAEGTSSLPCAFPLSFRIVTRPDPLYTGSIKLFLPISVLAALTAIVIMVTGWRRRQRSEPV